MHHIMVKTPNPPLASRGTGPCPCFPCSLSSSISFLPLLPYLAAGHSSLGATDMCCNKESSKPLL